MNGRDKATTMLIMAASALGLSPMGPMMLESFECAGPPAEPVRPTRNKGKRRNDRCDCGSGKKFKNCCMG